jgi:UDP-N-acetylmuramoyl-L-alanyl-D-glutamate--2,6-diaminopimelate ligase
MEMKKKLDDIVSLFQTGALNTGNLKSDSRKVRQGDVFVAVRGNSDDGHEYIDKAVSRGALAVIFDRPVKRPAISSGTSYIKVADSREALGELANAAFGDPGSHLKLFGVTGTNGKTTTVFLLHSILKASGLDPGFLSTVYNMTMDNGPVRSLMTTPGVMELYRALRDMKQNGKDSAVLEVSSHALSQKRIWGIEFKAAVFTNITPEHLDYHGDMDSYFMHKSRIFGYISPGGTAVLNRDDDKLRDIAPEGLKGRIVTFAVGHEADFRAKDISYDINGTSFVLDVKGEEYPVRTRFPGEHNVYNILGALSAAVSSGVDIKDALRGVERAVPVPGRMERVVPEAPFRVFVDYAHTPDALKNVLLSLRRVTRGKLICAFGCGGDRDTGKRPKMGKIASEICDMTVLTSDNPRSEDPLLIIEQIQRGVLPGSDHLIIEDRALAIERILSMAGPGDTILVAGKGHENHQIIGHKKIFFDDREKIREIFMDKWGVKE